MPKPLHNLTGPVALCHGDGDPTERLVVYRLPWPQRGFVRISLDQPRTEIVLDDGVEAWWEPLDPSVRRACSRTPRPACRRSCGSSSCRRTGTLRDSGRGAQTRHVAQANLPPGKPARFTFAGGRAFCQAPGTVCSKAVVWLMKAE